MIDRRATVVGMLESAAAYHARIASAALRSEMETTSVRVPTYSSVRWVSPVRSLPVSAGKSSPGWGVANAWLVIKRMTGRRSLGFTTLTST